jgi:hypothetical protein
MIFNNIYIIKLCFCLLLTGLSYTLLSCEEKRPDVIIDNLVGNWQWINTYDANDNVIEESGPNLTKSLKIGNIDSDDKGGLVFRFYTNNIKTDSLFMYNGPGNPSINRSSNTHTLYIKAIDSERKNALIRVTQYYPKNERVPNRTIVNIQRNTDIYKASSDTIRMEYIVDVP